MQAVAMCLPTAIAAVSSSAEHVLSMDGPAVATFGSSTCPAATPKGLLYNHVSKMGGTSMKSLVKVAFGVENQLYPTADLNGSEPELLALQPNASVFINDDAKSGHLQNTPEEASMFFIVQTVRRPCEFYLSLWAYISDFLAINPRTSEGNPSWDAARPFAGQSSPYTNEADIGRFQAYMATYSSNTTSLLANKFADRIGTADRVHCWTRTDRLFEDTEACFDHYVASCGGSLPNPSWRAEVEVLNQHSSGTCSQFFDEEAQARMMAMEEARFAELGFGLSLEEMGVESCCPPEEAQAQMLSIRARKDS